MGKGRWPAVPWITADGTVDMSRIPLESTYQAALDPDQRRAGDALRLLESATHHGRTEAGVFLMGLLVNLPPDHWEMRRATVDALRALKTERCAALLFSELGRVTSWNTTRRYLNTILEVLSSFPEPLVRERFEALAEDPAFSARMRRKFRMAVEDADDW